MYEWIFRIFWPKMALLGAKFGKGCWDVHPNELVLTFGGCYLSARLLLAKIDKKRRP